MIKRTPSRNTRSRGFRVKHVLQICLLLGVCFWLIYQVKHSHDKKKEFDEKDAKISVRSDGGITNLGRKGLIPHVKDTRDEKHEEDDDEEKAIEEEVNKMEENKLEQKQVEDETKHDEEEEEREEGGVGGGAKHGDEEEEREEGSKTQEEQEQEENKNEEEGREEDAKHEEEEREEEGIKHEDEEQEEETKSDETEDEGRGGGDDEIDERDLEKIEGEADHEEEFVDEEKEREEEGDGKENRNDEGEDKETQVDQEASTEDQDHDGGAQIDHKAREVHYNADDASSAVTQDTQVISMDPEKSSSENSTENLVTNNLVLEKNFTNNNIDNTDGDQKSSTLQLKDGEGGNPLNVTVGEEKGNEGIHSEDQLPKDKTVDSVSNNQKEASNKLVDVNSEAVNNPVDGSNEISGTSRQNETIVASNLNQTQTVTVGGDGDASIVKTTELKQVNNDITSDNKELDSNLTVSGKTENNDTVAGELKSSANSELDGSDKTIKPEVTAEAEVNTGSNSTANETTDASQDENSHVNNESGGTDESTGSSETDENGAIHDPIDSSESSVGQDEKQARIDLDTLPDNSSEGVNSRNAAAE